MNRLLTALQERLLDGLAAAIGPDGGLQDPLLGRPSPPAHYGHCATALALAIGRPGDPALALGPLRAWLALPDGAIGHLPFNRLLLTMLPRVMEQAQVPDPASIQRGLARCRLERSYPSNNWALLAQACRLVESAPDSRPREAARMADLLERWTTAAGGFIDFPAAPGGRGRFSTPIAYHHKALFLAALAVRHHPDPRLLRHLARMLDWLAHCWDPAGYAGGLGRSSHALFGDACLLGALILLGLDLDRPDGPVAALARRLAAQQRPDGLLWLDPAGPASEDAAWDGYMYLSVYNAWTAALIGLCRHLGPIPAPVLARGGVAWAAGGAGHFHDADAGLLCLRGGGVTAILSTRGQAPQAFSRDEAEFRYAGGTVLHLSAGDRILAPPPCRIDRSRLLRHPLLAGWTPVLEWRGGLYGLSDFDGVEIEEAEQGLALTLTGRPTALTRGPPSGPWQRVASVLDWRLLGGRLGRRAALRRPVLEGVTAELRLALRPEGPQILWRLALRVAPGLSLRYLNPGGHLVAGPCAGGPDWVEAAVPSALPGAMGRSMAPIGLGPGIHGWQLRLAHDGTRWHAGLPGEGESPARPGDGRAGLSPGCRQRPSGGGGRGSPPKGG